MASETLMKMEALAVYIHGCLLGIAHPDDPTAFPTTVCAGDLATMQSAIRELRRTEPGEETRYTADQIRQMVERVRLAGRAQRDELRDCEDWEDFLCGSDDATEFFADAILAQLPGDRA